MVVVAARMRGSVADSVCSVGAVAFKETVMSINWSSVGIRLARTSVFCSVGWRSEMNLGDMNFSCA